MKFKKSFWLRMIPVFIIVLVTIIMSCVIYKKMVADEKQTCWERLEIATKSTAEKIRVRINDNLNFLDSVSDSFVLTQNLNQEKQVGAYLDSVVKSTIFERIDVILPDEKIITQDGEIIKKRGDLSYEQLVEKGTHISPRRTSLFTGKEVIYCITTIEKDGKVEGILCGTIDCETLGNIFEVFTYGVDAQIFLIDCTDGSYLIDNWHGKLDNIHNLGKRKRINGEGMVDFVPAILNRETGKVSFVSKTNGKNSYQYYTPVEDFNWELCVVLQEDVVFAHVDELKDLLFSVAIIECMVLALYVIWNIWINIAVIKSEEKTKVLEMERVTNEAKARFISNMSHDVRTPINGIVGMLHIIKTHRDDEKKVAECLDKIEISTKYLSTLANDMLDISEIEHNKNLLENVPIDLRELVDELNVLVEQKAKEAKVTVEVDYSGIVNPFVIGSPIHIERILVNLIGNAIKYNKEKGGKVYVYIEEAEGSSDRGNYRFVIKDNGIGISEEFQKNMYDAFAQENTDARTNYQGYGLGLTIVHRLVNKMNGKIELKSKKEEGSVFVVTLPLEVDKSRKSNETEKAGLDNLSGINILLVEDNEINMEIAEVILSDFGANVTMAENGKIAVEKFEKSEPYTFDVILMDIMMPEMDGVEATKIIREMDRADSKDIPIIAMTASAFEDDIKSCKEAGMDEHIAKPLDVNKMISKIYKVLIKSGS